MWVQNGTRVTERGFDSQFKAMFYQYFGCSIMPLKYRHLSVTVAREFIPPQFHITGDMVDLALAHSTAQASHRYGVGEGDLPYLTHDAIWDRAVCQQWWNMCGVGPLPPPVAIRLSSHLRPTNPILAPVAPTYFTTTVSHSAYESDSAQLLFNHCSHISRT